MPLSSLTRRCLSLLLVLSVCLPSPTEARSKRKTSKKNQIRRHYISLKHLNSGDKIRRLKIIEKRKGRLHITKRGRKRVNAFLRDRRTGKRPRVPDRLIWFIYLVGNHYQKPIEVVSGLRSKERKTSRHHTGQAIDFRIPGVKAQEVWSWCKNRFTKQSGYPLGLGWYPTSNFVHMDVRDESYYWIDDSGPGEDAKYRKSVTQPRKAILAQRKKLKAKRAREKKREADRKRAKLKTRAKKQKKQKKKKKK